MRDIKKIKILFFFNFFVFIFTPSLQAKNINIRFVPIDFSEDNEIKITVNKIKEILNNFFPLSLYKGYITYSQKKIQGDIKICEVTPYNTISLYTKNFIKFCEKKYDYIYIIIIKNKINKGLGGTVGNDKIPVLIITTGSTRGVILHEFSHAVFGLGDEYSGALPFSPSQKEIASFKNLCLKRDNEEWEYIKQILNDNSIDYYEGGLGRSKGVYHAYPKCLMQDAQSPLCPICVFYAIKVLNRITGLNKNFCYYYIKTEK